MNNLKAFDHKFWGPGFFVLLPGLLGFLLFYIAPFLLSLGYGFTDKAVGGSFAGLDNYADLLQNPAYLKALKNSLIFMGLCIPLNMALSLVLALMVRSAGKYRGIFVFIFLIPLVVPSGSMVFFWKAVFSHHGMLNGLLNSLGLTSINWLASGWSRLVVLLIFIWKNLGYNMVLFLAGLGSIPPEYYEAAQIDGAGRFSCFRYITAVSLAPTFVLVLIMSVVNSFKVFKEIYLITGSYPHESIYMLQHFMNNMFNSLNYQKLATATSLMVLIMTMLTQLLLRLERKVG